MTTCGSCLRPGICPTDLGVWNSCWIFVKCNITLLSYLWLLQNTDFNYLRSIFWMLLTLLELLLWICFVLLLLFRKIGWSTSRYRCVIGHSCCAFSVVVLFSYLITVSQWCVVSIIINLREVLEADCMGKCASLNLCATTHVVVIEVFDRHAFALYVFALCWIFGLTWPSCCEMLKRLWNPCCTLLQRCT